MLFGKINAKIKNAGEFFGEIFLHLLRLVNNFSQGSYSINYSRDPRSRVGRPQHRAAPEKF